jgi:2-polyprenyl-3-methyl-5-hydroxy-6-metoxy-1,4-benzoquinol methylase
MINISNCPVCASTEFTPTLNCKDYTVSGENFQILVCNTCEFKFTSPRPEDSLLGNYYKSDDYISHSNTRKGFISRLYHLVRNYTLKGKLNLVSKYVSRGTILDYGCGTGMFLGVCQLAGWTAYGCEPDSGAAHIAKSIGVTVFSDKADIKERLVGTQFDAITLWHVLEHVTDLNETLSFFRERLSADGVLMIALPNHRSFDADYYGEFWAAYDVPRHLYHFHKDTIQTLLSRFGFYLVETLPMKFDSFYVSMLSEKYKKGAINYLRAFVLGLKSNFVAKRTGGYSSLIYVFKKK